MPRSTLARSAALALLVGTLSVASPAPAPAAPNYRPWGSAFSQDHVLRRGCHDYTYRYRVDPPMPGWSAEIRIVGPGKLGLASNLLDAAADPKRGSKTVTVCRASAPYGVYRIKMKLLITDGRDVITGRVKPTTFRFVRPRR